MSRHLLAFMAATLVLAVTLGVAIRTGFFEPPSLTLVPAPSTQAIASPAATAPPDRPTRPVTFKAIDGSFEIQLPRAWTLDHGPDASARYLRGGVMELSIRAGDGAGRILTCDEAAGPWETCDRITATSLDELATGVGLSPASEHGVSPERPVRGSTTLGGKPARIITLEAYENPARGSEFVAYVVAAHDARPYLLRLWTPSGGAIQDILPDLLAGFEFQDESHLELFSSPEDGYQLLLPSDWAGRPRRITRGNQEATSFGNGSGGGTRGSPALVITIGQPDGTITLCGSCAPAYVDSVDDLEALLESTPSFYTTGPNEKHADLLLGGEPARSESAGIRNNCLGCPDSYFHVYALHGGRPIVLAFDYWTVRFKSIALENDRDLPFTPEMLVRILGSFRFPAQDAEDTPGPFESEQDALPSPSGRTNPSLVLFSNPDDGYQVQIPATWDVRVPRFDSEPAVGVRRFGSAVDHAYGALTISIGDADGTIRVCHVTCSEAEGQLSLDDLEQTLKASSEGAGWSQVHDDSEIDGEPARVERLDTGGVIWAGYPAIHHVITRHDGRPVVLSFDHWSIQLHRLGPASVSQIIESFRFLEPDSAGPSDDG